MEMVSQSFMGPKHLGPSDQITEAPPTLPKRGGDDGEIDEILRSIIVVPEDGAPDEVVDEEAEAAADRARHLHELENEKQADLEREFRWRRGKLGASIGLALGFVSGYVSLTGDADLGFGNALAAVLGIVVLGGIQGLLIGAISYATGAAHRTYVECILLGILIAWAITFVYHGWQREALVYCLLYAGSSGLAPILVAGLALIFVSYCIHSFRRE